MLIYWVILLSGIFLSWILTFLIIKVAYFYEILDYQDGKRKKHLEARPLLGGVAIISSFLIIMLLLAFFSSVLWQDKILPKHILGIALASIFILIGGVLDDIYTLPAKYSIIAPLLAVFIILVFGIGIEYITNPKGGIIDFRPYNITLYQSDKFNFKINFISDLIVFIWILGISYTTKLLDGVDGLVTGLGVIASFIIFFMSLFGLPAIQISTAFLSLLLGSVLLGFLFWNFYPARIFLGEAGSVWVGFMLGVLSIISGSKIATAFLIMGIPILDVVWIILRRWLWEKKSPFSNPDRKHLHFRLLDLGFSPKQTVLIYYFFALSFGSTALFLQTTGKIIALGLLVLVMIVLAIFVVFSDKKKNTI